MVLTFIGHRSRGMPALMLTVAHLVKRNQRSRSQVKAMASNRLICQLNHKLVNKTDVFTK